MTISPFTSAINQVCDEKNLSRDIVISTVEQALAAAYRREYGRPKQIIKVVLDESDIEKSKVFQIFNVVSDEDFTEEANQIKFSNAKKTKKKIKIEDEYLVPLPSKAGFGRIAAQTAKQVIIQRLQEAERDMIYEEFKTKEGQLVNAVIQQFEGNDVVVNVGRTNAILPVSEQIPKDKHYIVGQRIKVYIATVEKSSKEPKIIVSRNRPELIRKLFEMEVPEIASGTVKIEGIAREAGSRTKMSVSAHQPGLDPVGSCVGQRGIRVQAVLADIGEEKIDIILYDEDCAKYIMNALSPAKIENIKIDQKKKQAKVYVNEDQLSLAIGKNGQNVRLASKITGFSIDIEKFNPTKKIEVIQEEKKLDTKTPKRELKVIKKTRKKEIGKEKSKKKPTKRESKK